MLPLTTTKAFSISVITGSYVDSVSRPKKNEQKTIRICQEVILFYLNLNKESRWLYCIDKVSDIFHLREMSIDTLSYHCSLQPNAATLSWNHTCGNIFQGEMIIGTLQTPISQPFCIFQFERYCQNYQDDRF